MEFSWTNGFFTAVSSWQILVWSKRLPFFLLSHVAVYPHSFPPLEKLNIIINHRLAGSPSYGLPLTKNIYFMPLLLRVIYELHQVRIDNQWQYQHDFPVREVGCLKSTREIIKGVRDWEGETGGKRFLRGMWAPNGNNSSSLMQTSNRKRMHNILPTLCSQLGLQQVNTLLFHFNVHLVPTPFLGPNRELFCQSTPVLECEAWVGSGLSKSISPVI